MSPDKAKPDTEPGVAPTSPDWKPGDPDRRTDRDRRAERAGQEPGDLGLALTPSQIFGGFALLAAILVVLRRRGRPDSKG